MPKQLTIVPEQYGQVDGLDPEGVKLVHWLSIQSPEDMKACLEQLSDGEVAKLAHVGIQLQMLLNSKKGEAALVILNEADKALAEVQCEFNKKEQTRADIKKTANKGWFRSFCAIFTGSSKAELAKAAEQNAESDAASLKAQNRVIESYKKDAEIGVRLCKMQSNLILLDQCIHLEEQKSIAEKIEKSIRLFLTGGRSQNQIDRLIPYTSENLKVLSGNCGSNTE